jgi:hypothetical protein
MTTRADSAAARAAMQEQLLAEVAAARTVDEVRAAWVGALRTTAFCLLERPARERLFDAAADQIAHIKNSDLPHEADAAAGVVNPGITAGSSGTQKDPYGYY